MVYHADLGIPGAALAVSQFFTLSGYLITSLVLHRGSVRSPRDFLPFWTRRYRRLAPASLMTLGGVLVFGATIASQQQLERLPGTILAALAQVVNWHFIFSGMSYVGAFSAPSPLQHFWSLAIEEQFYLAMPILLLVLFRLGRSSKLVTAVFALGAVGSTVLSYVLYHQGAAIDRLYFGTDTRAAEILVGCVLGLVLHQRPLNLGPAGRRVLSVAGVGAAVVVYWSWLAVPRTDPLLYQGGYFVHALLSAVMIVTVLAGAGPLNRVLSVRPLAALGRISYTVYCFHWPLYLWLTADRTGLDGWGLLAFRSVVSIGLAALSVHFIENPIRYGRRRLWARRSPLPVAFASCVVLVVVGTVAIGQRHVVTDLAGLGEAVSAPVPAEPMKVLVIHDERGGDVASRLAAVTADDVTVEVASPFHCDAVATGDAGPVCGNWQQEWGAMIDSFDPDIVLFHVTDFPIPDAAQGIKGFDARKAWIASQLEAGFQILTSRGARVAWGVATLPTGEAVLRRSRNPFWAAMNDVAVADPNVRSLRGTSWYDGILDDLRAFQRPSDDNRTRVMVVGDSVSRTIGYGLERWAARRDRYLVWSAGTEGCGLVAEGHLADRSGREIDTNRKCQVAAASWRDQVKTFRPDIVVVSSTLTDIQRRRLDSWDEMKTPGDAAFDDFLVNTYVTAQDAFASGGAQVVWITPLCYEDALGIFDEPDGRSAADPDRIDYVRRVIYPRLVAARPDIRLFDLYDAVCPDGRFAREIEGVDLRPDGAHFSAEGAVWVAEHFGTALLEGKPRG